MQAEQTQVTRRAIQFVLSAVTILALVWASLYSGRIAISRILVKYGLTVADISAIDTAIGLTPSDAEVHYAHGAISNYFQQPGEAVGEFERAASLRPHDYYFWLELGMTREQLGDRNGALFALNEAVRLAPYYAQPRWQRGNFLYRKGDYDQAFADLRQAAASNPDFLPALIDLAWGTARKDAQVTEQLVQTQSNKGHFSLALFFARHGKPDEAVAHFRSAGTISAEERRDLIKELLLGHAIGQAYDVWSNRAANAPPQGLVFDGGFEGSLNRDEAGFGWRLAGVQPGLSLSLDGNQPQSGARSLRVDFSGHAVPAAELISQLIPVEPAVNYKLNFAFRTREIVTGGPLMVVIKDANNQQILGHSTPLPADTNGWQMSSVEFATGSTSRAVVISLQREDCTSSPCPIFGSMNLDSFSLQKLK
jgi:tetratricopeptide (TPR) repeat protein